MFLKKMSTKGMGCDPKPARKLDQGAILWLAVVGGVASDMKHGENRTNGDVWSALVGQFTGVNIQEGSPDLNKTFESGLLFLPGGIQEYIEGAVRAAGDNPAVEFAIKIGAKSDEKSNFGFVYCIENLQAPSAQDRLSAVRKLMQQHVGVPLIKAPAPEPEPVPAPEPEPAPEPAPVSASAPPAKGAKKH